MVAQKTQKKRYGIRKKVGKSLYQPRHGIQTPALHFVYISPLSPPFLYCMYGTPLDYTSNRQFKICFIPFSFLFCVKRRSNNAWGEIGGGGKKEEQSALLFFVIVVSLWLPPTRDLKNGN